MRNFVVSRLLVGVSFVAAIAIARGAEPIRIPLTADRWAIQGGAGLATHNGVDSLVVMGQAVLNDFTFRNGTIEFDVDPVGQMGAGVGFRRRDKDTFESFYVRPDPKCAEVDFCLQYAPQTHGVLLWDLYPQYQAPAPLRERDWNHLKFVVSGRRLNVFVNGAKTPTLQVGSLEGDTQDGGLMLQGPGFFANFTVTPDAVEGLAPEQEKDPTADDRRYIRNWQLAPAGSLPAAHEPQAAEMPAASAPWRSVAAERGGLVNITRELGLPFYRQERSFTWAKTTIRSEKSQTKDMAIGWVREVWVFVNGKPVYTDKNLYQPPSARKTPAGRCSVENGKFALPLKPGDNEIAVAIADNFYGWGFVMRLNDLDGVQLAGM
jgi:hypothetical protein